MSFDLNQLQAEQTATMMVYANEKPTNWVWVFAGPNHERTKQEAQRLARQALHVKAQKEQAQANSKKWKSDEQTPDEFLGETVSLMASRLLEWHMVDDDGQ